MPPYMRARDRAHDVRDLVARRRGRTRPWPGWWPREQVRVAVGVLQALTGQRGATGGARR